MKIASCPSCLAIFCYSHKSIGTFKEWQSRVLDNHTRVTHAFVPGAPQSASEKDHTKAKNICSACRNLQPLSTVAINVLGHENGECAANKIWKGKS